MKLKAGKNRNTQVKKILIKLEIRPEKKKHQLNFWQERKILSMVV